MKKGYKTGFTLAEIMVVLAVLSILLAVMLPSMTKKRPEEIIVDPIWKRHESGTQKTIYFGIGDKQAALIGGRYNASSDNGRLVIHSANDDQIQFLTKYKKTINDNDYEFLRGMYFGNNHNMYLGAFVGQNGSILDQRTLSNLGNSFTSAGGSNNLVIRPNGACGHNYGTGQNIDSITYFPMYNNTNQNNYCFAPLPNGDNNTIIGYMAFASFFDPIKSKPWNKIETHNHIAIGAYASTNTACPGGIGSDCHFMTTIGYNAGSDSTSYVGDITAIGAQAGTALGNGEYNNDDTYRDTMIGAYAGHGASGNDNLYIGAYAGGYSSLSNNNIAIGYRAFSTDYPAGYSYCSVWYGQGQTQCTQYSHLIPVEQLHNTINIGAYAGYRDEYLKSNRNIDEKEEYDNKFGAGYRNISVGAYSNANMNTDLYDPLTQSQYSTNTATDNIAIGYRAKAKGENNTVLSNYGSGIEGWNNTLIGYNADLNPYEGTTKTYGYSKNVFVGQGIHGTNGDAGSKTPASSTRRNVYIGYNAIVNGGEGVVQIGGTYVPTSVAEQAAMEQSTAQFGGYIPHEHNLDVMPVPNNLYIDKNKHNIGIGFGACHILGGNAQNKTCIGYNSGPTSTSATDWNDDNKTIYLGNSDSTVYMPHIRTNNLYLGNGVLTVEEISDLDTNKIVTAYSEYSYKNLNLNPHNNGLMLTSDEVTTTYTKPPLAYLVFGDGNFFSGWTTVYNPTRRNTKTATYSDKRLKNTTSEFKSGLDKIRQIKVLDYTFKADKTKKPHVGVIAQDLQEIFPDAVSTNEDGYLTIRLTDMFYALVNSVKELNNYIEGIYAQIDVINSKITGLEQRKDNLKQQNKQLKEQLSVLDKRLNKIEHKGN